MSDIWIAIIIVVGGGGGLSLLITWLQARRKHKKK